MKNHDVCVSPYVFRVKESNEYFIEHPGHPIYTTNKIIWYNGCEITSNFTNIMPNLINNDLIIMALL